MRIRVYAALAFLLPLSIARPALAQQPGLGTITTIAGNGTATPQGTAPLDGVPGPQTTVNFTLGDPSIEEDFGHMAADSTGNLYFADKSNHRIRKVDTRGIITTIAGGSQGNGGDGGPASRAQLNFPTGLAFDRAGNLYVADEDNNRIRKIDANGNITAFAGRGGADGYTGDGGPALNATFSGPCAVAADAAGNVYIADTFNDVVRKVATNGTITTLAGNGQHGDDNNKCNGASALIRDNVDAKTVCLGWPSALVVDASGNNLFVSDHHNNVVRAVNLQTGLIRRVVGTGQHSDDNPSGDTGSALLAPLGFPMGLAFDAAGNLYVSDMHNNAIRRVTNPLGQDAVITTPVGSGFNGFAGDGGPAPNARLSRPTGLAIDSAGSIYFADWYNQRVRKATAGNNTPQPILFQGGLVNGASFLPAPARTAPGSIVAIFGRRMAPGTGIASTIPLPRTLLDPPVSVNITPADGSPIQMPLFFVSPDQINAQMPVEVTPGAQAVVTVRVGSIDSSSITINVSPTETGIFLLPGTNHAIAINIQDGRVNNTTEPAARGSFVTVFITGEGELDNPIPTGQAAPPSPLSRTKFDVQATIGGQTARVDFLGATPGFVGFSQANILVPDNAPTGEQILLLVVGGHESNRPVISIK
jgi:uncharacterized protein (TIGR03437 family)